MAHESAEAAKKVVVIGGGFGGVAAARGLAKHGVEVLLIDKNAYQGFLPMLYQVASAQIASGDVAFPLGSLASHHRSVGLMISEVVGVDAKARVVTLADGTVVPPVDYLIFAAGAQPNFFGTPGVEHSFPLYTLKDAERLKSHLVRLLHKSAADPENIPEGALSVVVVGAGATGVECAGSLADLFNEIVPREFPQLADKKIEITVVDGGAVPLGAFTQKAQKYATEQLEQRGVTLRLGNLVSEIDPGEVTLKDGTVIAAQTVVWGGGNKAAPVAEIAGLPTGKGGRINVDQTGAVDGFPGVFAIGDIANMNDPDGNPYPGLGAVSLQQGSMLAQNILRDINGETPVPFKYHDKGMMAMIGRNAAIAEIGKKHHTLEGPIAWSAWLGVHMYLLQGVREKSEAFASWAWDYFSRDRSQLRIIGNDAPTINWDPAEPSLAQTANGPDATKAGATPV